jgi:uncharacterized protein YbaR (Trm112 family)
MAIDRELLEDLVCPVCQRALGELPGDGGLECSGCGRVYPVRDGIPVMRVEEASKPTKSPQTD